MGGVGTGKHRSSGKVCYPGENNERRRHPDVNFTPYPRNDMSRKALSTSPTRPMSDGITVGASSTFDRLMMSMG